MESTHDIKPVKVPKFYRDILEDNKKNGFVPGPSSPICAKCKLNSCGAQNPYMSFWGAEEPEITVVLEGPTKKEDAVGELTTSGVSGLMLRELHELAGEGYNLDKIRWALLTRCAIVNGKGKSETGGRWCRHFLVDDIIKHRPKILMPVGSTVLGWLCHKGSAQDWGGKLLTYRGWPDDWLTDPKFDAGHPLFGEVPGPLSHIPMMPVQSPRIVYGTQNPYTVSTWRQQLKKIFALAKQEDFAAPVYDKPWWRLTDNPDEVIQACVELINNPGTVLTFDTETTGLNAFLGDRVVFMMMRWNRPDGTKMSLGWPWDYKPEDTLNKLSAKNKEKYAHILRASPMLPFLTRLAPYILGALAASKLRGHNLTFDLIFVIASLPGGEAWLNAICSAFYQDTWHMRYALRQERGSIGLDLIAYDWAPGLAGYEEPMTLLIDKFKPILHPGEDEGGHYANCPPEQWDSHFKPYVMGDVEVCHEAGDAMYEKLHKVKRYRIPLANPDQLGKFRLYDPPSRRFVYDKILAPGGAFLAKIMARGMHVDLNRLAELEMEYPRMIFAAKAKLRKDVPEIERWCRVNENLTPGWKLDLENKDLLKEALFKVLNLPIKAITETGARLYKDLEKMPEDERYKYAATDKFSMNAMAATNANMRPLLDYKVLHKAYTSYVRPMRNITTEGIDKKARAGSQLLGLDGRVHANFKIPGTRTGRLACSNPNLQQLPRDGLVKSLYISRWGQRDGCIYQGDLSQIELRLLAAACGDPAMVQAYRDGSDLHSLTTSKVFKIEYEHFTKPYYEWLQRNNRGDEVKKLEGKRKIGKTLNFLTGYGGGAFGFQSALALQGIYITLEEAEFYLAGFFENYPMLQKHIGLYKRFILETGLAVSITGRVRILEDVRSDSPGLQNKALRAGYNHLIQSTASDMMLLSMVAIETMMREEGLESMLISTVHDSLAIDTKRSELPQVHDIVTLVLNNMPTVMAEMCGDEFDLSWANILPLSGDSEVGVNYLETIKIPGSGTIDWDYINAQMDKSVREYAVAA